MARDDRIVLTFVSMDMLMVCCTWLDWSDSQKFGRSVQKPQESINN